MLARETIEAYVQPLRRFLAEPEAGDALQRTLVEAEWDQDLDDGLRDALARIRLFVSEAFEGLRPPEDVRVEITRMLYSLAAEEAFGSATTEAVAELPCGFAMSGIVYSWDSANCSSTQAVFGPPRAPKAPLTMDVRNVQTLPGAGLDEVQLITEPARV
jgi:hypothetical protein